MAEPRGPSRWRQEWQSAAAGNTGAAIGGPRTTQTSAGVPRVYDQERYSGWAQQGPPRQMPGSVPQAMYGEVGGVLDQQMAMAPSVSKSGGPMQGRARPPGGVAPSQQGAVGSGNPVAVASALERAAEVAGGCVVLPPSPAVLTTGSNRVGGMVLWHSGMAWAPAGQVEGAASAAPRDATYQAMMNDELPRHARRIALPQGMAPPPPPIYYEDEDDEDESGVVALPGAPRSRFAPVGSEQRPRRAGAVAPRSTGREQRDAQGRAAFRGGQYLAQGVAEHEPDLEDEDDEIGQLPVGITTLVARNVPARYSQDQLLEEWKPDGSFDFLLLPCSEASGRSMGFVFINFVSYEAAVQFRNRWQGQHLSKPGRARRLNIGPAHLQGFEANMLHIAETLLHKRIGPSRLPAIFHNGRRISPMQVLQELRSMAPAVRTRSTGGPQRGGERGRAPPGMTRDAWGDLHGTVASF